MWTMRKQSVVLSALTLGMVSSGVFTAPAKPAIEAKTCAQQAIDQVSFRSGETLFTVLAWLNWVGDREDEVDASSYDPVQARLQQLVTRLPKALYEKHRKAYLGYLTGSSPYVKNGLLISDSLYYGNAPYFTLQTPASNPDKTDALRLSQLPPASLLAEFYQQLNLKKEWTETYAPVFLREESKYKAAILKGFEKSHCFLKVPRTGPVDVIVNPLDAFGTSGQTSYNQVTQRFLIKLHVDEKYANARRLQEVAAHEYTHALMNTHLAPYNGAFMQKMQTIGEAVGQDFNMPLQELFAQAVSYLDRTKDEPDSLDRLIYYGQNLLIPHLAAHASDWDVQNKSFTAFLPEMLSTLDTDASIALWHRVENKVDPQAAARAVLNPQEKEMLKMAKKHAPLLQPKLAALQQKIKQVPPFSGPEALVLSALENREHFTAEQGIRENVFYIYKNPLFLHFSEHMQTLKAGDSVEQWMIDLFSSFSVDKEATRWRAVALRFAAEEAAEAQKNEP
jgi:hypothetical protein